MDVATQSPVEALADALHGLDARIPVPLDEVPSLRIEWAQSLVDRLRARGFEIVPAQTHQPTLF